MKKLKIINRLRIAVLIIASVITLVCLTRCFFSISNYNHNSKIYSGDCGYIGNQNELTYYQYGTTNLANNGCGVIATYNVLKMCGKYTPLPEIISTFEVWGTNILSCLGTNPHYIMDYLRMKGLQVKEHFDKTTFKSVINNSRCSIFVNFYLGGGHYQTVYRALNQDYVNVINPNKYMTFDNFLKQTENDFTFLISIA